MRTLDAADDCWFQGQPLSTISGLNSSPIFAPKDSSSSAAGITSIALPSRWSQVLNQTLRVGRSSVLSCIRDSMPSM